MRIVKFEQDFDNTTYWNEFYKKFHIKNESSFCNYIKSKVNKETIVVDLGCGMGQDTWSFYKDGYIVTGVDQSIVAISHNNKIKAGIDACNSIEFLNIDISSEKIFPCFIMNIIEKARTSNRRILVYARFLLHSITEKAEKNILENLSKYLNEGDLFAAEFRTIEDKDRAKIYKNHYRRYINSDKLITNLECKYSFNIIEYSKGTGFSVLNSEDPFLARIIAKKS